MFIYDFTAKNIVLAGVKVCIHYALRQSYTVKRESVKLECSDLGLPLWPCCLSVCRQSLFMTQRCVRHGTWAPIFLSARRMCRARKGGKTSDSDWERSCIQHLCTLYTVIVVLPNYPLNLRHRVEAVCTRVAELNPYVHVDISSSVLDTNTDLSFLRKYQVWCDSSASWSLPT